MTSQLQHYAMVNITRNGIIIMISNHDQCQIVNVTSCCDSIQNRSLNQLMKFHIQVYMYFKTFQNTGILLSVALYGV